MTTEPPILAVHDAALAARLQARLDRQTKPVGALGRLEALALQIGLIQRSEHPQLSDPQLLVFAADHGLAAHGISAYPSDVTWQMVENFLAGGAAVSVLARQHGIALSVIDAGVRHDFAPRAQLIDRKIARGTADSLAGPAMSAAQCAEALAAGRQVVAGLPGNVILLGEMGIGNTSAASMLMARLTGLAVAACAGRGTGLDDAGLARKVSVLSAVLARHEEAREPLQALAAFGGFEIAMLAGATLQAAAERRLVVVDGFITSAAVLVAARLAPAVLGACVFAHRSADAGHGALLDHLGATPLLDLGLRLGEGSGAALAWPLIDSAVRLLAQMASFESAGVSERVVISAAAHELRLFFIALQFFTRVPVPRAVGFAPDWLNQSARYFPAVGSFVGSVAVSVWWAAAQVFPATVAAGLSMAATIVLTGAFHEDGFADTCDGLGGAVDRERALAIMKDSRIGAYGAIGLVVMLWLKASTLAAMPVPLIAAAILFGHTASRAAAASLIRWLPYAGYIAHAKAKPLAQRISAAGLAVAWGWVAALIALLVLIEPAWLAPLALAALGVGLGTWFCARWLRARLGGYTGDTLGATQQITELIALLAMLAWR